MYLRKTKRSNKDGSSVEYFQLAHNERHPITRKPVAKIIHNFGRADKLDRQELVRLCQSIGRVCGLQVADPFTEIEDSSTPQSVLPTGLKIKQTRAIGCVLVIEELWKRLGIKKTIDSIEKASTSKIRYERALLAMVANRLCDPESKLSVWDRWLDSVHLPSCDDLELRHMYEAMDLFHEHAEKIEETIFFNTANLFNLEVDLIFYDTTTASFSIDAEDDDDIEDNGVALRKYGHTKEGTWAPQVVVALAVTREGIPVRSWVMPGNTADVGTVEKICTDLRGWNQIKMTPMYHWASRHIESHVKICVLALLIERLAELQCGMSWHRIRGVLNTLQVTEFFDLNYRVLMRNEMSPEARNILKSLDIPSPKKVLHLEQTA